MHTGNFYCTSCVHFYLQQGNFSHFRSTSPVTFLVQLFQFSFSQRIFALLIPDEIAPSTKSCVIQNATCARVDSGSCRCSVLVQSQRNLCILDVSTVRLVLLATAADCFSCYQSTAHYYAMHFSCTRFIGNTLSRHRWTKIITLLIMNHNTTSLLHAHHHSTWSIILLSWLEFTESWCSINNLAPSDSWYFHTPTIHSSQNRIESTPSIKNVESPLVPVIHFLGLVVWCRVLVSYYQLSAWIAISLGVTFWECRLCVA